jgi:hypothetical protein
MDRQAAWIVVYELGANPAPIPPGVDPSSVRVLRRPVLGCH